MDRNLRLSLFSNTNDIDPNISDGINFVKCEQTLDSAEN